MPITKTDGVLVETPVQDKDQFERTGVIRDDQFAVCDLDRSRQLKFSVGGQDVDSTVILAAGANSGTITLTLPTASGTLVTSAGIGNSFTTIQTPAGTSPVADSSSDTLTLTSSNNSITITGNSTTDTIDLITAAVAAPDVTYTPTTSTDWISAPTTAQGALDNLAAYVSGGLSTQVKTANYTALKTDGYLYGATAGGAFAFTIPTAASVGAGKTYKIKKTDTHTNVLTISRSSSDTFDYEGTTSTSLTCNTVNEEWEITSDGTSKWYVNSHHTSTKPVLVSNPTLTWTDNMTTNTLYWWREGCHLCVRGYVLCSGTPSTGGNFIATIPNSSVWAIDTNVLNTTSGDFEYLGTNKLLDSGNAWWGPGWIGYKTSTTLIFYNANNAVIGKAVAVSNATPFTFASGDAVFYEYKVPISGWYA